MKTGKRDYEGSPPQGPSRGTAGQCGFSKYQSLTRRGAPFGATGVHHNRGHEPGQNGPGSILSRTVTDNLTGLGSACPPPKKIISSPALSGSDSPVDRFNRLFGGQDRLHTEDDERLVFEELGLQ